MDDIFDLNYAIEIYNPTDSTINLSAYSLVLTNSIGIMTSFALSGNVAAGDVHVVTNTNADSNLVQMADQLSNLLNFETTVVLVLKKGTTVLDKIGQNGIPTAGSIDLIQLIQDPYAYLLTFHLDLNDYNNIDIRRSMFDQEGNPSFNSATDIIGHWGYFINTDRTNIGVHRSVCKPTADPTVGFVKLQDNIYHNIALGQITAPMALNIVGGTIPYGTTI